MENTMIYYIAVTYILTFVMLLMIVIVSKNHNLNKNKRTGFIRMFLLITAAAYLEFIGFTMKNSNESMILVCKFIKFIELSMTPLIPIYTATVIFRKKTKTLIYPFIILGFHAVLEAVSIFTGSIVFFDNNVICHNGPYYFFYILICIWSLIFLLTTIMQYGQMYQNRNIIVPIILGIYVSFGVFFQVANENIKIDWLISASASAFFYIYYNELTQYVDGLTKLLNQRSYKAYITHVSSKCIVLVFDVNHFKNINDTLGHQFGDNVLKIIAKLIQDTYSKFGPCFRIGGDEFCVIIESNSVNVLEINDVFFKNLESLQATTENLPSVSLGYAHFNPEFDDISDVIAEADRNMYKIKEWSKKNQKQETKQPN